jgi:hypothetical protein
MGTSDGVPTPNPFEFEYALGVTVVLELIDSDGTEGCVLDWGVAMLDMEDERERSALDVPRLLGGWEKDKEYESESVLALCEWCGEEEEHDAGCLGRNDRRPSHCSWKTERSAWTRTADPFDTVENSCTHLDDDDGVPIQRKENESAGMW